MPERQLQDWIAHYWFRGATPVELVATQPKQYEDARIGRLGRRAAWLGCLRGRAGSGAVFPRLSSGRSSRGGRGR